MKKTLKKCLLLLLLVTMIFSLAGCNKKEEGGENTDEGEKAKVVYAVLPTAGGSAWGRLAQGAEDKCKELGWDFESLAPLKPFDATQMAELCSTAVNAGADVLMVFTQDETLFAGVLEEAKAKGVYTIALSKPNFACNLRVGANDAEIGYVMAEALVEAMGDKEIHVLEMMTDAASEGQLTQITPFEEKLKEIAPNAEIVSRVDCHSNTATAQDVVTATYMTYPEMNAVISVDAYGALGSCSFVTDYGLEGEFVIISIDDSAETLLNMKKGLIQATVNKDYYSFGYLAVQFSNEAIVKGEEVPFFQNVSPKIIYPADVDKYAAENGISLD